MVRMIANDPGDRSSVPGQVIPENQKSAIDVSLLSTQNYKVRMNCKVGQSRERSSALPLHFGVVAIQIGAFE